MSGSSFLWCMAVFYFGQVWLGKSTVCGEREVKVNEGHSFPQAVSPLEDISLLKVSRKARRVFYLTVVSIQDHTQLVFVQ